MLGYYHSGINHFDITYLCNRIDRLMGEDEHRKLSPWGQSNVREFTTQGYQNNKSSIF